jgi:hypothetical protein
MQNDTHVSANPSIVGVKKIQVKFKWVQITYFVTNKFNFSKLSCQWSVKNQFSIHKL